jgi:hypothetical protein
VLLTGLNSVCAFGDLPSVSCLIRVSLGCAVVGQFLANLELFARRCVGFFFLAGSVLGVFMFQGLEKSLRLSGTFVVRLLQPPA